MGENIRELFRILSFDAEPMVSWGKVIYYKDADELAASEGSEIFASWLKRLYGIDVCDNSDALVKNYQNKFQQQFHEWMHRFVQA